ncbi:MAG: hypothetical protein R3F35_14915 [Myxococcota bacterium]
MGLSSIARGKGLRARPVQRRVGALLVALPAALLLAAGSARAATLSGSLAVEATDAVLLAVDCADDGSGAPASMTLAVRDLAPVAAPIVSAQVRKGFSAKNASDAVDGDVGASPSVTVNGGAGRYDVYVDKNATGAEAFEVTAQCWTGVGGTGATTGTTLFAAAGGAVPAASAPVQLTLVLALLGTGAALLRVAGRRRGGPPGALAAWTGGALFVGALGAPAVRAHEQAGNLGTGASATDSYEVTCFDNGSGTPGSLEIAILDSSPGAAPSVSAQVHRDLALVNVSDDLVADALSSPSVYVNAGPGTFFVLVDKSGAGVKFYELTYHCWTGHDGTGVHAGSALVPRQNE